MQEKWQWDETLFAGTAAHYVRGRLPYAPNLAEVLADTLGLDGQGRLLDVGCGPGIIGLLLAHHFESVVGLDPDPDMLAEAARLARERDVTNASWVCCRAEEIRPAELGEFRVVTFAASFHWMDRPRVASVVRSMLDPNGAAVQIDAPAYRPEEAAARPDLVHSLPPQDIIANLRERYLGPDRRAGQGVRNTSPGNEDRVFTSVGYQPAQRVVVPDGRVIDRTIDDLVAGVLSTSSTAPHLFGSRLPAFEADLRAELAAVSPSGLFSVYLPDNRLSVWRPSR